MSPETPDYKLGQLDQAINDIQSRVKNIECKVEELNVWKIKMITILSLLIFFLNFAGNKIFNILF